MLAGCGESDNKSRETTDDPCDAINAEADQTAQAAKDAVAEYNTFTGGRVQIAKPGAYERGERARLATLTAAHIVADNPECFSATTVGRAESLIPLFEHPGAVPTFAPTP